jgi:hypothetical protein
MTYEADIHVYFICHHHHQWHHGPINNPWPLLGHIFPYKILKNFFLQGEDVSLTPNPQPRGPLFICGLVYLMML